MRSIRSLFLLTLIISPLLFGTVEFWSLAFMELHIFLAIFLWLRKKLKNNEIQYLEVPLLKGLILLLLWAIFQIIPLPLSIIKLLSPRAYSIYSDNPLSNNTFYTLSIYPHATIMEIMRFISYIIAFFLTIQLFSKERSLLSLVKAMMVTGTVIALIGIFQMIFNDGKLLWLRELRQGGTPFGPYVNRNHFAGLMEMLIPLSTGMLIICTPPFSLKRGLRYGLSESMRHERVNVFILSLTSIVIMITALFLSLSRGGITGLSISMLLFGVFLALRNSTRKKGILIGLLSIIILLTVGWFGWDKIIERFERLRDADVSSEMRLHNWKDSTKIITEFLITGTGLGTYKQVYPLYKTILSQERWEHAHNDYIEGVVELGLIGLAIAIYILVNLFRVVLKGLMKRKYLQSRLLALGTLIGITGVLIHSITDFNLHIGANGLFFSVLFGIALSAINIRPLNENGTMLKKREVSRKVIIPLSVFLMFFTVLIVAMAVANIYYLSVSGPLKGDKDSLMRKRDMLDMAARLSPLDSRFPFEKANISSLIGADNEAVEDYKTAVRLNPLNAQYLQMLGLAFDRKGEVDRAEQSFELSINRFPTSSEIRKNYALYLLSKGRRSEGIAQMKEAINLDPSKTRLYITGLVLYRFSPDEIREIVPENSLSQLYYGRFREDRGELAEALDAYMNALSLMRKEGAIREDIYLSIGRIYEKKGMLKEALSIYEEGVNDRPNDYSLRVCLGRTYERLNLLNKAIENYERALLINPSSRDIQLRLRRLRIEKDGK